MDHLLSELKVFILNLLDDESIYHCRFINTQFYKLSYEFKSIIKNFKSNLFQSRRNRMLRFMMDDLDEYDHLDINYGLTGDYDLKCKYDINDVIYEDICIHGPLHPPR